MKKFLSLVLALVMAMSLVTVSAGAKDFTDDSSITYDEAVAVISAAGIVDGYTDGSFNPSGNLTRGAASKIICNLILGPTTAAALSADTAPYSDVPVTNEFSGYIAYCQAEGIISGYADGTFRPAATLTGYAFMKMLLGALDYDSDIEGYTGANWSVNVAKRALGIDMDDGYEGTFVGTKALTREEACLFAFNTLTANMVNYPDNSSISVGDITITNHSKAEDVVNNAATETIYSDNILQFAEKYFTNLKLTETHDDFGRPADKWSYKGTEIGTYANDADYTYTAKASGDTAADKVKDMGLKDFDVDTDHYTVNGKTVSFAKNASDAEKLAVIGNLTNNGVLIQVYTDDVLADTINDISVIYTQIMQVNVVRSTEVTLKTVEDTYLEGVGTIASVKDDDDAWESVKDLSADDFVLVVPVLDGTTYKADSVTVPETVTGSLTNIKVNASNNTVKAVTVAGTEYPMSCDAPQLWTSEDKELNATTKLSSSVDTTIYLDVYGNVIYAADVTASNSAIIIDEIYSTQSGKKIVKIASGWDSNGNEIELNLGTSPSYPLGGDETDQQGKVYEYATSTANNAEYRLIAPKTVWNDADKSLVYSYGSTQSVDNGQYQGTIVAGKSLPFDSAVKFIFISWNEDDVTGISVKEGVSEVSAASYSNLTYILNKAQTKIVAVVVDNDYDAGNTTNLLFFQKVTNHVNNDDGKRVAIFTAYINGATTPSTGLELNKDIGDDDYNNKFFTYSESNGVYSLTEYKRYSDKITTVTNGAVSISGSDLTGYQDYYFKGVDGAALNARNAVVVDLYGDDGVTFSSVKEMKDAIVDKTINAKTGAAITGFEVAYVYNDDSGNSGNRTVAYLYVTKTLSGTSTGGSATGAGNGSSFTSSYAVASNGNLSLTMDYVAADWVKDAGAQDVTAVVEVYASGVYYNYETVTFHVDANGEATASLRGTHTYPTDETLTFQLVNETPAKVAVKYINGDDNSVLTRVTGATATLATNSNTAGNIEFTVNTSNDNKTLKYTVSGLATATDNKTDKTELPQNDNAKQTISTTTGAKGDSYVVVTVYGLKALEASEKFKITLNTDITGAKKMGGLIVGAPSTEEAKITVDVSAATDIVNGGSAVVSIQSNKDANAYHDAYNYAVTLKINGQTITHEFDETASTGVTFLVEDITGNLEIKASDITVVAIPKLAVTSATWSGNKITLTFNHEVDETTGEDIANYTYAQGTGTNTSALYSASVSGKTVTLTFSGAPLQVGNTIVAKADVLTKDVAGNVCSTTAANTLAADGAVTLG